MAFRATLWMLLLEPRHTVLPLHDDDKCSLAGPAVKANMNLGHDQ